MEWWSTDDEHGSDVERSYGAWVHRQPWWLVEEASRQRETADGPAAEQGLAPDA